MFHDKYQLLSYKIQPHGLPETGQHHYNTSVCCKCWSAIDSAHGILPITINGRNKTIMMDFFFFYHWQVLLPVMMKWENTTMGHTYSNCQQWQTITNHWEWYTQTASISKTSKPHGGYIQKAVASNGQTSKLLGVIYTNSCQQWQNHWVSYTQTVASNGN